MGLGVLWARYSVPGVTGISVPLSCAAAECTERSWPFGEDGGMPLPLVSVCVSVSVHRRLWSRLCSHHRDQRLSLAFWEYQCWRIGWYSPQLLFLRKAWGHTHTSRMRSTHVNTHANSRSEHSPTLPSHMQMHKYSNTLSAAINHHAWRAYTNIRAQLLDVFSSSYAFVLWQQFDMSVCVCV